MGTEERDIEVQSTQPRLLMTECRCRCGRLLFKYHLEPGQNVVEVKCHSCNAYSTVRAAESR